METYKLLPYGNYYTNVEKELIINDTIKIIPLSKIKCGTGKYWKSYRLGDTVGGKYNKKFETIKQYWPGSIKDKYMKQSQNKANKHDILCNIIKEYPMYKFDTSNFIIIGIRVGDVLGACTLNSYIIPINHYKNLDLKDHIKKTVIICCGSHYDSNTPKSIQYINDLYNVFKDKGFENILVRAGNSPDDDLCLMCGAEILIPGRGGFHNMIRILRILFFKNAITICTK